MNTSVNVFLTWLLFKNETPKSFLAVRLVSKLASELYATGSVGSIAVCGIAEIKVIRIT